ncbi:hypothetical protein MGYG_04729 [Nannizzia gypsea CBS 118893]|uniref:Uncharacterized protein n=1 Tax=Arthroderma gypseum (strain ATCC MYA-4604 / CBS 118893) TaxID=535722 RepID=E4UWH2_ARTGP|nr:hypothetical protein MGYG_04729 [Nannizzia gypsea CBS 118893]EFR01728.1 hypothetical protein MGYG_04729 [Nannizzia gypsea CBS 118893]
MASNSVKGSILSAVIENNASLANLKFDFSLVKVEAPVEFERLGSALTVRRRDEAEYGPQHQTARRLAALFEPLVPSTPNLISAYGKRVSEIIESPGINPVGSRAHGPFRDFIGADGTAVWAAATSGVAALGIYLLSCLLVRAWDSKEAISIWVELVDKRKQEIQSAFERNISMSTASAMSSLPPIARDDLALWDASSRSWLRSADQAKQREHDQLLLISKNINMPYLRSSSMYDTVVSTWKRAMLAAEDLLCGRPQSISDAGVILALSSWHLYPDLIVLRNKTVNVKFGDPLFPSTGVCTIGFEQLDEDTEGVRWSLALSHLQYYGGAAKVTGPVDHSRVTISQLRIVALGGLLGHWGVVPKEFEDAVGLFCCIGEAMDSSAPENPQRLGSQLPGRWIYPIIQASRKLNSSRGEEKEENIRLLKYGQRRAQTFLRRDKDIIPPYFGLCNQLLLSAFSGKDCDIVYLRGLAQSTGYASSDSLIVQPHWVGGSSKIGNPHYFEYATAVPLWIKAPGKRSSSGEEVYNEVHARWYSKAFGSSKDIIEVEKDINNRIAQVSSVNERCHYSRYGHTMANDDMTWLNWNNYPPLLRHRAPPGFASRRAATSDLDCFLQGKVNNTYHSPPLEFLIAPKGALGARFEFTSVHGNRHLALCVRDTANYWDRLEGVVKSNITTPAQAVQYLRQYPIQISKLDEYLTTVYPTRGYSTDMQIFILSNAEDVPQSTATALHALYISTLIYNNLDQSAILLRITSQPLCNATWVRAQPDPATRAIIPGPLLTRQEAFACIAHFDSGQADVIPRALDSALAMCTQNSIFVAAAVLSDPLEDVKGYEIRRLVGNIGKRGISMLVAPRNPRIREPKYDHSIVNHAPYDGKRENNFNDTSLHLSFTEWTIPLATADSQTIDQDVFLVESVISVRDRGELVADLDILGIHEDKLMIRDEASLSILTDGVDDDAMLTGDLTSIDSWEELLDPPLGVGVFRAHGNWVARLAATSILMQRKKHKEMAIFNKSISPKSFGPALPIVKMRIENLQGSFILID